MRRRLTCSLRARAAGRLAGWQEVKARDELHQEMVKQRVADVKQRRRVRYVWRGWMNGC